MSFTLLGPRTRPIVRALSSYRAKQCPEATRKDIEYDPSLRVADDPFFAELKALGKRFEAALEADLLDRDDITVIDCRVGTTRATAQAAANRARRRFSIAVILTDDSPRSAGLAESATHYLAERPGKVEVIWNAHLRSWKKVGRKFEYSPRSGRPDVMVKTGRRPNGRAGWTTVDVKAHKVLEANHRNETSWERSLLWTPSEMSELKGCGPFKASDALQLAHYQRMLEFHELDGGTKAGIIGTTADDQPWIIWADLSVPMYDRNKTSALTKYDAAFAAIYEVAEVATHRARGEALPAPTIPEMRSECASCAWRDVCYQEVVEAEDITLLPGVTPARAAAYRQAGINTYPQLANLDVRTGNIVAKLGKDADVGTLIEDARNDRNGWLIDMTTSKVTDQLLDLGVRTPSDLSTLDTATAVIGQVPGMSSAIDQARVFEEARRRVIRQTHLFRVRGVDEIHIPRGNVELHIDMEEDGEIYLWGVYRVVRDGTNTDTSYKEFVSWTRDAGGEAKSFGEFFTYVQEQLAEAAVRFGPNSAYVYHYTAAEDRCMTSLAKRYGHLDDHPSVEDVEDFLASPQKVDLYPLLTSQLVWPTENHSLKTLAKYCRFVWRDEDPSGANSQLWFREAINEESTELERETWRHRILRYNEDDCRATAAVLDFIGRLTTVSNPTKKVPSVSDLDGRYGPTVQRRSRARAS